MHWKDEEVTDMRDELEFLREQNKILQTKYKEEKMKRQILEANKLKYTMLKELEECRGQIVTQTFFENKRT